MFGASKQTHPSLASLILASFTGDDGDDNSYPCCGPTAHFLFYIILYEVWSDKTILSYKCIADSLYAVREEHVIAASPFLFPAPSPRVRTTISINHAGLI
jgi:hypothetical protein